MGQILVILLLVWASASFAHADGELDRRLTAFDKDRLARFDATLAEALAEAKAGGSAEDLKVLDAALDGEALPLAAGFDPTGSWKCRTIKAGKSLPLVVYPWFRCRISDDGAGWVLEKLSGSQRTKGRLYTLSDTRLAYLGAGHYAYEDPRDYGEEATRDQVAFVERRGPQRIVVLFPAPQFESKLDVLLLER
jgi:hypothetical protein